MFNWRKQCIPKRIDFYILILFLNFLDMGLADARSFPRSFLNNDHFLILSLLAHLTFVITAIPLCTLTKNLSARDLIIFFSSLKPFLWLILYRTNYVFISNIIAEIILGLSLFLFCITPIYLEEIIKAKDRGKVICTIFSAYWVFQIRIPLVSIIDSDDEKYISKIFFMFLFSLTVSASNFLLPHSPVWLIANGDDVNGRQSIEKLREKGADTETEMNLIKEMLDAQETKTQIGFITLILSKRHLFKNIFIMMVVFFLREPIRTSIHTHFNDHMYDYIGDSSYILGQLLCCCIVDYVRRKVLLLVSLCCNITLICMSVYVALNMNILFYEIVFSINSFLNALGLDLLPYVLMVEIIPYPVRRIGAAISVSLSFTFIMKQAYLFHMFNIEYYLLYATTIFTGLGTFIIYFKMPETKGVANRTNRNTQNTENNLAISYSRMGNEEIGSVNIDI